MQTVRLGCTTKRIPRATGGKKFAIPRFRLCGLMHILKSSIEGNSDQAKQYHWHQFEQYWQSPDADKPPKQIYDEIYSSPVLSRLIDIATCRSLRGIRAAICHDLLSQSRCGRTLPMSHKDDAISWNEKFQLRLLTYSKHLHHIVITLHIPRRCYAICKIRHGREWWYVSALI